MMSDSDNKKTAEHVFASLPSSIQIVHASCEIEEGEGRHVMDPCKKAWVTISFSEKGFGFGEILLVQTKKGLFIDSERMGREGVMHFLQAMVDSAIFDTETDPEKHALFNEERGRWCGGRCAVCFQDGDPIAEET